MFALCCILLCIIKLIMLLFTAKVDKITYKINKNYVFLIKKSQETQSQSVYNKITLEK